MWLEVVQKGEPVCCLRSWEAAILQQKQIFLALPGLRPPAWAAASCPEHHGSTRQRDWTTLGLPPPCLPCCIQASAGDGALPTVSSLRDPSPDLCPHLLSYPVLQQKISGDFEVLNKLWLISCFILVAVLGRTMAEEAKKIHPISEKSKSIQCLLVSFHPLRSIRLSCTTQSAN